MLAGFATSELVAVERYPRPRRLWKLSLNLRPPHAQLTSLLPWLQVLTSERVWAMLPFRIRFF